MFARHREARWLVLLLFLADAHCSWAHSPGGLPCDSDSIKEVAVPYVAGTISIDGDASDWKSVRGETFKLLQAIGPPKEYTQGSGSMLIKAAHDGQHLYVLLQAPGAFAWSAETPHLGPSVSLMFGIGDNATFHSMGGCPAPPFECNEELCQGYEVDLIQFELSTAVPGRLYGGNLADNLKASGHDSIGHLNDMYGWNAYCKKYDSPPASSGLNESSPLWAASGAQNEWHGAWSHTSISNEFGLVMSAAPFGTLGESGDFVFEFTRPLRTLDRFQQDVQLTIGSSHRFAAALWYPENNAPWGDSAHYATACDWTPFRLLQAPQPYGGAGGGLAWAAITILALLCSVASIALAVGTGWWVKANSRQFTQVDGL